MMYFSKCLPSARRRSRGLSREDMDVILLYTISESTATVSTVIESEVFRSSYRSIVFLVESRPLHCCFDVISDFAKTNKTTKRRG